VLALQSYQTEAFQKAISSGRYARHREVLAAIYDLIQSADLPAGPSAGPSTNSNISSSLIHLQAELPTAEPGWQWW
jgi:hypothetical protein